MKKILSLILALILISSLMTGCGENIQNTIKAEKVQINLGNLVNETKGNTNSTQFNFESSAKMLESMILACQNEKFELYYSPDNMSVALKNKQIGNVLFSNPFNAAKDQNYSGNVANKLNSQIVVTYLEEEKSLVDMYSSKDCADLGQYTIKTYENGLVFDMSIGEEKESNNLPMVLTKTGYEEIYNAVDEWDRELLELYYVLYTKDSLKESGIYDVYPDIKAQDVYYCNLTLSEREMKKLSAVFETAGFTEEKILADNEKLNIKASKDSYPNFKVSLNYNLTENGVKVTIPNDSISFNEDFPLLRISVLPYFAADIAFDKSNGYLFIPDGTGAVINMNQNEPNRRTIITGKVYGENASALPKKTAVEKTEQYYLPVFGTVRNNATALFGIISSGDANSEITALLGRPNGNYYTTYPEFIIADYEQYTRMSVVSNPWSNKEMYLYDKNITKDDLSVEYYFLNSENASYSGMAEIYRNYLYNNKKNETQKPYINIETLGSVLANKSFLGFEYEDEIVLTSFKSNMEMLKELKESGVNNLSLQLKGWQKNGLSANVSNKVRISSSVGGKSNFSKLYDYCKEQNIPLSLYNNISFVGFDKANDDFKTKEDAARTLELKYAFDSEFSPATMQSMSDCYVVKSSSYDRYLTGLTKSAKKLGDLNLNLGELGTSLNADYTKDNGINRGETLSFISKTLKNNEKNKLSFDGGNAYVLPYAEILSNVSNENSGFIGESAAVPFLQMVIGSNATYTSAPINLKDNTRYELLNCIESGTVPTFLVSYENTSVLKNTEHTSYFAVDYEILKNEILDSYKYVENVFSKTNGSAVIDHNILSDKVTMVTYENGTVVYVNKSQNDYAKDGVIVKALDYLVKE